MSHRLYIWIPICIYSLVHFFALQSGIIGVCTDDFNRTYVAAVFSNHSYWFPNDFIWLPAHSAFYSFLYETTHSIVTSTHIINTFFGIGSIFFGTKILNLLSYRKSNSLIFGIMLLCSSLWTWVHFSMLTEPMFSFLILSFLYTLLRWHIENIESHLFAGTLFFFIFSATRNESWFLIPFFSIYLLTTKSKFKYFYIFLSCSMPFLWLFSNWHNTGDVFFALKRFKDDANAFHTAKGSLDYAKLIVLQSMVIYFPWFLPASLIAIFRKSLKTEIRILAGINLFWAICIVALVWKNTPTTFNQRLGLLPGLLGTIIFLSLVNEMCKSKYFRNFWILIAMVCGLLGYWHLKPINYSSGSKDLTQAIYNSSFLKKEIKNKRVSLIGNGFNDTEGNMFVVASESPQILGYWIYYNSESDQFIFKNGKLSNPHTFILSSEKALLALKRHSKISRHVSFKPYFVVSSNDRIINELSKYASKN